MRGMREGDEVGSCVEQSVEMKRCDDGGGGCGKK